MPCMLTIDPCAEPGVLGEGDRKLQVNQQEEQGGGNSRYRQPARLPKIPVT